MRIDLFLTPGEIRDSYTKDRRVVLVDVLRSCTSVAVALHSGAERIVPADSVEGAKQLLALLDRKVTLLAGDKDGAKLPGFDLGNSPDEFRSGVVAGKTILFTSSNAAPLMAGMYDEAEKPLLSFVNLGAVAAHILAAGEEEVTILCAGQDGHFTLEDAVCAGMLCYRLLGMDDLETEAPAGASTPTLEINDGAQAALLLYQVHQADLLAMLRRTAYGGYLARIGCEEDLVAASRVDSVPVVPVVREGRITAVRPAAAS